MSSSNVNATTLRRIVRAGTASSFGSRPGMRRHHWTELELQELSIAYLEHRNQMPLWKIAQMLEFSFASPKPALNAEDKDDDAPITPKTPKASVVTPRTPSVQAITSKLMDCVFLETRGHLGYKNVFPSQLHCQVWEHVKLSQRHREMIAAMKMSAEAAAKTAAAAATNASKKQKLGSSILNVHAREFLYDTVEEYEAAFPPAKRRKIINDNDDDNDDKPTTAPAEPEPEPEQSQGDVFVMSEICEALDEIAQQIEEREQDHQRNNQAIQDSLANIHNHEYQIAMLLTTIHDATAQIETHRQAIAKEMATIESSFAAASAATAAAAAHTQSLGPLTHAANSSFDPNNYQCRQCSQLFDPRNGGFWLIGPNRETGDTFYLCRECTRFMEETTMMTPTATATATATEAIPLTHRIDEYSDDDNCNGDCDCWDSEDDETYYGHGYDHGEECS
uniref:Uncharacterized protein n=1 Tax=viral metagenome TaxID=1070528 RepID=A0A6C0EV27_9ZZZZ